MASLQSTAILTYLAARRNGLQYNFQPFWHVDLYRQLRQKSPCASSLSSGDPLITGQIGRLNQKIKGTTSVLSISNLCKPILQVIHIAIVQAGIARPGKQTQGLERQPQNELSRSRFDCDHSCISRILQECEPIALSASLSR